MNQAIDHNDEDELTLQDSTRNNAAHYIFREENNGGMFNSNKDSYGGVLESIESKN